MQVAIYIYKDDVRYRLELFQDENISITSSIQNVNDISKVFTDYSQSFTVPATPNNNKIFAHWYENSIDDGFNANKRYDAEIEINMVPFRKGRIELQSANRDNGNITHYSLVFYGTLKSLTDKFGEDKLINLTNLNDIIDFDYSSTNVVNSVVNTNTDNIAFPLISSNKAWQYGGGIDDISTSGGSIDYRELFPAVRVKSIFQAIEEKYNVSFLGNFLSDKRFTELFILAKNSEKLLIQSTLSTVDLVSNTGYDRGYFTVDFTANTITYNGSLDADDYSRRLDVSVNVPSETTYELQIFKDGVLFQTINGTGPTSHTIFEDIWRDDISIGVYSFKISSTDIANTSIVISTTSVNAMWTDTLTINTSFIASGKLDVTKQMPDMKISDFFSGVLKMFNLTAYSENENEYNIEPLEDWYNAGQIRDITKYVNLDGEITRAPFYKVMNFQYEKSESLINRAFFDTFQREFGDLKYTFDVESDGDEYTIKLPFENLMHQKFSGTKLHVGYCLKSDLKPYVPKPILLYKYGNINTDVNFYLEGVARTSYNAFGQDIEKVTDEFHTLNWGLENSTLLNGVIENTLFSDYYLSYLSNIYNRKSRIIKIEGVADTYLMSVLKLNDRVVIRDKRYVINNIQTELNTGKINLELLTDFRAI